MYYIVWLSEAEMINGSKEFIIDCYKLTVHLSVYWGYTNHFLVLTLEKHCYLFIRVCFTQISFFDNRNVLSLLKKPFLLVSIYRKLSSTIKQTQKATSRLIETYDLTVFSNDQIWKPKFKIKPRSFYQNS